MGRALLQPPFRHGNGDDTKNSGQGGFLISNAGEDKYTKATVARENVPFTMKTLLKNLKHHRSLKLFL